MTLGGVDMTPEQIDRLMRLLGRMQEQEERDAELDRELELEDLLHEERLAVGSPAREQFEAAIQWMGDFTVAVRGYLSSDLAEGGELAAMKEEMRSRVMRMLESGRPW
jgi:hypothetical protein